MQQLHGSALLDANEREVDLTAEPAHLQMKHWIDWIN